MNNPFDIHTWRVPGFCRRFAGDARERSVGSLIVAQELERAGSLMERIVDDWGGWLYLVSFRARCPIS